MISWILISADIGFMSADMIRYVGYRIATRVNLSAPLAPNAPLLFVLKNMKNEHRKVFLSDSQPLITEYNFLLAITQKYNFLY